MLIGNVPGKPLAARQERDELVGLFRVLCRLADHEGTAELYAGLTFGALRHRCDPRVELGVEDVADRPAAGDLHSGLTAKEDRVGADVGPRRFGLRGEAVPDDAV